MMRLMYPGFCLFISAMVLSSTGTSFTSRAEARSMIAEAGAVVPIVITWTCPSFIIATASLYEAWKFIYESDW